MDETVDELLDEIWESIDSNRRIFDKMTHWVEVDRLASSITKDVMEFVILKADRLWDNPEN